MTEPLLQIDLPLAYKPNSPKNRILYSLNSFLLPLGLKNAFATYSLLKAKNFFTRLVTKAVADLPVIENPTNLIVVLEVYRDSNRRSDCDNKAIMAKWATDMIVQAGIIPDDDHRYITGLLIVDKGLDKENPRVVYNIKRMK